MGEKTIALPVMILRTVLVLMTCTRFYCVHFDDRTSFFEDLELSATTQTCGTHTLLSTMT